MCFLLPTLLLLKPERVFDYLPAPTSTRARLNTTRPTYQWRQVIRLVVGHATSTFNIGFVKLSKPMNSSPNTQQAGKPSKKQRRAAASSEALAGCCRRMIDDADDVA